MRQTRNTCWKLNGKSSLTIREKTSLKKVFQGFVAKEHESVMNSQSSDKIVYVKDQLELLYKMVRQIGLYSSFSSHFAKSGNINVALNVLKIFQPTLG